MQVRKTYNEVSPELLYAEIKDFVLNQGVVLGENKVETYTLPDQSADFVTRGTMTFNLSEGTKKGKECLRVHIVGTPRGETKLIMDVDEELFPTDKLDALQSNLDFVFSSYEVK